MTDTTEIAAAELANPPLDLAIQDVMENNYLDYAMSVITGRALPDARDGLKPVHRRILHSMNSMRIMPGSPHKKSARIVGDVIGKYHPHGDSAVYDAAVRMAQEWVMPHPLIDGQGNFGSMDGDGAAAMRYTEMRLTKTGASLFGRGDMGKETVDFVPNYDGTESEPTVLPVTFPNLWVSGVEGIAVGMATRICPHNLIETANAFMAWLQNPDISLPEIAQIMPAPDFPTGGLVHGLDGYLSALESGRGRIRLRARWHEEDRRSGKRIVLTEIPYLTNKAVLVESIATLVQDREIEGIVDLRDESNKKGVRVVLDLKKGYEPELIMAQLIAKTDVEISISYNVRALVAGKPQQLGIKDIFQVFNEHRLEVIQRRTQYDLDRSLEQLHILEGLIKAVDRLDETIAAIRASSDAETARAALRELLSIDDVQAQAILDMKLQRLTGLQILDIRAEHDKLTALVADLRDILASHDRQTQIMVDELIHARDTFGTPRRTEIAGHLSAVTNDELVKDEEVVVMATRSGYVKRLPIASLNRQNRGTRGRSLMDVGDDDFVTAIQKGSTRDYLLAVTDKGQVHAIKVHSVHESAPGSKGRHYRNIFQGMADDAHVVAMLSTKELSNEKQSLVIYTQAGYVKRTSLNLYVNATRKGGVAGITIEEGDAIVSARLCDGDSDLGLIVGSNERAVQFRMSDVRAVGRTSRGVRGINLPWGHKVIAGEVLPPDDSSIDLVCIGENGVGKRSSSTEFGVKGRGGKGMICFQANARTGKLVAATLLRESEDLVIFNETGGANRISGRNVPKVGRNTSGASMMKNGTVRDLIAVPAADEPADDESEVLH